ncbi:hypothetical protein LB507_004184 [Fusarium sp. FIESC RH6]|nr:hypothetical protein LB507_004184 [Fusarium sp. FIESC RH6]
MLEEERLFELVLREYVWFSDCLSAYKYVKLGLGEVKGSVNSLVKESIGNCIEVVLDVNKTADE